MAITLDVAVGIRESDFIIFQRIYSRMPWSYSINTECTELNCTLKYNFSETVTGDVLIDGRIKSEIWNIKKNCRQLYSLYKEMRHIPYGVVYVLSTLFVLPFDIVSENCKNYLE
jgi:hypothetical protein